MSFRQPSGEDVVTPTGACPNVLVWFTCITMINERILSTTPKRDPKVEQRGLISTPPMHMPSVNPVERNIPLLRAIVEIFDEMVDQSMLPLDDPPEM